MAAQNLRNVVSTTLHLASLAREAQDVAQAERYTQEALTLEVSFLRLKL